MFRIEICGGIASGKTTLAKMLEKKGYSICCEEFQKNPFFEHFYQDPLANAFETEVCFLLQHYHDIKTNRNKSKCVYDFSLIQDFAYADINLKGKRKDLFILLAEELLKEIKSPTILIYLSCSTEIAQKRIKMRNRKSEQEIPASYLEKINSALENRVFHFFDKNTIFSINSGEINFHKEIPVQISKYLESFH